MKSGLIGVLFVSIFFAGSFFGRSGGLKKRIKKAVTEQKINAKKSGGKSSTKASTLKNEPSVQAVESIPVLQETKQTKVVPAKVRAAVAEKPLVKAGPVSGTAEAPAQEPVDSSVLEQDDEIVEAEIEELESQPANQTQQSSLDGVIKTAASWTMTALDYAWQAGTVVWRWLNDVAFVKAIEAKNWIAGKVACQDNCSCHAQQQQQQT